MNRLYHKPLKIALWIIAFNVIGIALGSLSDVGPSSWYSNIIKSPLTPPDITFGIVWPILYTMLAIAAFTLYDSSQRNTIPSLTKKCFAMQIALNWSWTPLFFYYHLAGVSLLCLLLIVTLTSIVIANCYRASKLVALLCVPYLAWCCFASYLSYFIWANNP